MSWRKLGRVYVAAGERSWQQTHAFCPTVLDLGERLRVFCAFLDADKVGRLGFVDVDRADPKRILEVSAEPALDVGAPGCFDDNGVTPLAVVRLADGRLRLYYAGWQLGVRVRYYLFTGAAESDDDGLTFTRVSQAPVLDRSDGELSMRTGGFDGARRRRIPHVVRRGVRLGAHGRWRHTPALHAAPHPLRRRSELAATRRGVHGARAR